MFYRRYYIYCLINKNGDVFYVGLTKSMTARMHCHRSRFGRNIFFEILQSTGKKKRALRLEVSYTKMFHCFGYELKNKIIGIKQSATFRLNKVSGIDGAGDLLNL